MIAQVLVLLLLVYVTVGVLFALAFVWRGAACLDPAARGAPLAFRIMIFPASVGLWPYLAARWTRAGRVGVAEDPKAHRS